MASQSDDFARMIELLEQILERLPPKPHPGFVQKTWPTTDYHGTGDYVCPTCGGNGLCQCNTTGGA